MQFDFDVMPRSIGFRGHTLRPRSISSKQLARRRCCIALGGKLLYIEPHSKVMVNCSIVGDMHDAWTAWRHEKGERACRRTWWLPLLSAGGTDCRTGEWRGHICVPKRRPWRDSGRPIAGVVVPVPVPVPCGVGSSGSGISCLARVVTAGEVPEPLHRRRQLREDRGCPGPPGVWEGEAGAGRQEGDF